MSLVSALQKNTEPVQKITIVPRTMGALGYVMNVPEEEKFLNTEKRSGPCWWNLWPAGPRRSWCLTPSPRERPMILKGDPDCQAMITQYGMSEKFGLMGLESPANQYLDNGRTVLNCSDVTAAEVDQEVMRVLKESYEEAKRLLSEHRNTLDQIAKFLIERETITGKEFMDIFHRVEGTREEENENEGRVKEKTEAGAEPEAEAAADEEPDRAQEPQGDPSMQSD